MGTIPPSRSFMMQYRADDFPLYLLGIVLIGALIAPALPHRGEKWLLVASLAYMVGFFLIRHGAKFDWSCFRDALEGLTRYPVILMRNWWTARSAVIPIAAVFLLALTGEHFLRPRLAGTKWLSPFPWPRVVWTVFLIITLFRVTILIAHLLRASVVREVLEDSTQKKTIAVLPIHQHILQAFITGMLAHLSVLAPCVLFYMLTNPSYLREVLLVAGYFAWSGIAIPLKKRKFIEAPGRIIFNLVYHNHTIAHRSRFFFAIFHGHHHDAIPSALIGSAGGTGFFENVDRALTWLDFLNSVVVQQIAGAIAIVIDMVLHQYIPGVFPFAKGTVMGTSHHVTHHFGSALPLGLIIKGHIETRDYDNGYKADNQLTRWFLDQVERREGLDPELRRKFLTFGPKRPSLSENPSPG
ncbi:MAG TPA: hypothetical protein VF713_00295 [Thermoanaerobaculia bacterium]